MVLQQKLQKFPMVGKYKYTQFLINLTMDELIDAISADESPSDISDKIKEILFGKSAERIDAFRPVAAKSMFGDDTEVEGEISSEDEE